MVGSKLVTITCANHHTVLVDGLWNCFLTKRHTDLNIDAGGKVIQVHQVLLDAFLSTDKLVEYVLYTAGQHLDSIFQFLYKGTAIVAAHDCDDLLAVASELQFIILVDAIKSCVVNAPSNMVTVNGSNHHAMLIDQLWRAYQNKEGTDLNVQGCKQELTVHQVLADVFLSTDKLIDYVLFTPASSLSTILEFLYRGTVKSRKDRLRVLQNDAKELYFWSLDEGIDAAQVHLKKSLVSKNAVVSQIGRGSRMEVPDYASKVVCSGTPVVPRVTRSRSKPGGHEKEVVIASKKYCDSQKGIQNESCTAVQSGPAKSEGPKVKSLEQVTQSRSDLIKPPKQNTTCDTSTQSSSNKSCDISAPIGKQILSNLISKRPRRDGPKLGHRTRQTLKIVSPTKPNSAEPNFYDNGHDSNTTDNSAAIPNLNSEGDKVPRKTTTKLKNVCIGKASNLAAPSKAKHAQRRQGASSTRAKSVLVQDVARKQRDQGPCRDGDASDTSDKPVRISLERAVKLKGSTTCSKYASPVNDNSSDGSISNYNPSDGEQSSASEAYSSHLVSHQDGATNQTKKSNYQRPFRWHRCKVCKKKFTHSGYLTVHLRIHTKTNPFKCTVCEKSFPRRHTLTVHERTHSGAKPFKCANRECNKTFTTRSDLKRHSLVHSGLKAHQCKICKKRFALRFNLADHLLTHC